ncbi:phospholipase C [Phycicoccus badiiscoriae]|uniref:Phospholipase C n=1 Tax=Pedococcus badiiscoriae TaxID=642776 RepID=A0A852W9T2_9MICO|nr:alkaline phosphatase family protein [Pedococcus badiiscoriae]NYG05818.1 phospholipase C [Pedococcus badiiscoriae]
MTDRTPSPHIPNPSTSPSSRLRGRRGRLAVAVASALVGLVVVAATATTTALGAAAAPAAKPAAKSAAAPAARAAAYLPPVKHVFVINLENKGYDETWGPGSAAPYLSQTLRAQGNLLSQYYGTAHNSLPNYIAQVSGQGPNPQTQGDCQAFSDFAGTGTVAPGQYVGDGCVYPTTVPTLQGQLQAAGLTWRGYMEDMGTPCRHPAVGAADDTQKAKVGDQYATRHNPFMYFHSIIDNPASCAAHVVDSTALTKDLASVATTRNLTYITPNLCHDGHDTPCVDGQPGGLTSADAWLKATVPAILASPAYRSDGLLLITFDESDGPQSDATACCGEGPGPNTPLPGITGMGGGRVGALALSPFVRPGSVSSTSYNHYSLLASIEDLFGRAHLGYAAQAGLNRFGLDVYNR